jgi:hypothetical protein
MGSNWGERNFNGSCKTPFRNWFSNIEVSIQKRIWMRQNNKEAKASATMKLME